MAASGWRISLSALPEAKQVTDTKRARELIAEGRKHDEAMTDAPWSRGDRRIYPTSGSNDSAGIAWMRTNLRALLDGYAAALDEIEQPKGSHDQPHR